MVSDTFTRTSSTSPGAADTGEAWREDAGVWRPDGARMAQTGPRQDDLVLTIDTPGARRDVACRFLGAPAPAAYPGLVLNFTDLANFTWLELGTRGDLRLYRVTAGTRVTLATTADDVYAAGQTLTGRTVQLTDRTQFTASVQGVQILAVEDTSAGRTTGTRAGLRYGISVSFTGQYFFDDFASVNLTPVTVVTPAGRAPARSVRAPTPLAGPVALTPATRPQARGLGVPALTPGPVTLTPPARAPGRVLASPVPLPGPVAITPPGRASARVLTPPAAVPGPVKAHQLVEPFSVEDTGRWNGYASPHVAVADGRLRIQASSGYPSLVSVADVDLLASSLTVRVDTLPNVGAGTTQCSVRVQGAGGDKSELGWANGVLIALLTTGGATTADYPIHDPAHVWWRLRETASTLFWETSADAAAWTTHRAHPHTGLPWLAATRVIFTAGHYGTETDPGAATFDDLNIAPQTLAAPARPPARVLPVPVLVPGPVALAPPTRAPARVVSAPVPAAGTVPLTPGRRAPARTLTAPVALAGAVVVSPPSRPAARVVGVPGPTAGGTSAAPLSRAPARVLRPPVAVPGTVPLSPPPREPARVAFAPALLPGPLTLTPPARAPRRVLGLPALTPGSVALSPPARAPARGISPPAVVAGPVALTPGARAPARAVGLPALTPGPVVLTPGARAPSRTIGVPTLTPALRDLDLTAVLARPRWAADLEPAGRTALLQRSRWQAHLEAS